MSEDIVMSNEPQVFDYGDEPFFRWMQDNPQGYVLNTERSATSKYTFLHRSSCKQHLWGLVKGQRKDGYTKYDYIKVCSNNPQKLLEWSLVERKNIGSFSGYCKSCKPERIENWQFTYPDEISGPERFFEGAKTQIIVNSYERNPKARAECLCHHGYRCSVCQFDFESKYGEIGKGYVHVHHKVPLTHIGKEYVVNAIEDLIPVCPNCHAMLHRKDPPLTVEELKAKLKS
jgi:hypothetical protein